MQAGLSLFPYLKPHAIQIPCPRMISVLEMVRIKDSPLFSLCSLDMFKPYPTPSVCVCVCVSWSWLHLANVMKKGGIEAYVVFSHHYC